MKMNCNGDFSKEGFWARLLRPTKKSQISRYFMTEQVGNSFSDKTLFVENQLDTPQKFPASPILLAISLAVLLAFFSIL